MFTMVLRMLLFMMGLLGSVTSVEVTIPMKVVNVTAGMDATLLCTYTTTAPTTDQLTIQWSFYHIKKFQIITHYPCLNIQSMEEEAFSQCLKVVHTRDARGRCSWTSQIYYSAGGQPSDIGKYKDRITGASTAGNASITISNMQPSDSGVYICDVNNPPDFRGNNQGFVVTNVLVKPSKPFCTIRGTPEAEHAISLSCYSAEGMPYPVYQWFKVEEDTVKPVKEQYNPTTGLLVISNLTTFEKGHYRCIASNNLGNSSCEIDLTIGHSEAGIIAGALIGALLTAIIICLIVWFFMTKFKSKKRKGITKEMQPMTKTLQSSEYETVPAQETAPREVPPSSTEPELLAPNHEEAEGGGK
ncbi:V-set and immunoglobulin domain-containing protein 1 [Dromiciops gliroides]|uniref:V-set and immunoglobulin domain-containing protein 1 n=1 Tax=Dromiciops gliroides TaxID=33562 RepID=UPI001CC395DB|nr:V-set and immunoglobulin domain-containing protein 1 [Dromiciops gliroides]